jgi:hypothetical protein
MSGVAAEANFVNQPHAILPDDDHVVVLIKTSANRSGKNLDGKTVYVVHLNDGKMTESWAIPGDQYAQSRQPTKQLPITGIMRGQLPRLLAPISAVVCGEVEVWRWCRSGLVCDGG